MDALLIDGGNTLVKALAWRRAPGSEPEFRPLAQWPTPATAADAAVLAAEAAALQTVGAPLVLVTVIPVLEAALTAAGLAPLPADHRCRLPFTHVIEDLAAVGPDRLCNVAAARAAGLPRALIVDAGTATTFDLLLDGVFVGGLIAPGFAFAARLLGERAARLSPVPLRPVPLEPGTSTAEAMNTGAWQVGVGGVEAVIAAWTARYPGLETVLTGGWGAHLAAPGRRVDPHWTLRGALVLTGLTPFPGGD